MYVNQLVIDEQTFHELGKPMYVNWNYFRRLNYILDRC